VPKGTKDWDGKDMVIREKIFSTISEVFKRHGGVTIDTLVNDPASTRLEHRADKN
jgi:histidyl-tRNA synthetase